ncbi:hypothetical protein RND81_11G150600 [Saponaria officinalis]|uniref:RING-type domain-containing protein n=1 Tax=Saponaria officinalis TaxID=3572 RepID=A0AAW1HME8_SAPOF
MAIQRHMYPANLGLPISSQDYFVFGNNNFVNNNNNDNNMEFNHDILQHKLLQQQRQQQFQYQQQQQQQLRNMQQRNYCVNEDNFVFLQPSKKQKLVTATGATTTTTATTASTATIDSDNHMLMDFSQSLSVQLQKQGHEIDRYITLQNEWLKLALQEQRKQQIGAIIKKLESKTLQLLKQKDDEIEVATKRAIELQEIVKKLELENQAWQRIALENEAIVFSLNNTLEQLKQQQQQEECCSSSSSSNEVEDGKSSCNNNILDNNKSNNNTIKGETSVVVVCKVCKIRNACVLLLPCKHMCCCKVCDVVVDNCPLCNSPKMATIHALIS